MLDSLTLIRKKGFSLHSVLSVETITKRRTYLNFTKMKSLKFVFFRFILIGFCFMNSVISKAQYDDFQIIEIDANNPGHYASNPFLQSVLQNFDTRPDKQETNVVSSGCDSFWRLENSYNGKHGIITIAKPDYRKSVLRIVLSLQARLPSVCIECF